MKIKNIIVSAAIALFALSACSDDDKPVFPDQPEYEVKTGYAKGADVSWLTEMEKAGRKFYDADGRERECIELLRDLGMNSIRLRVWVNPANGWCNEGDVLIKAWRAQNLGMRLMIDFHYSDVWADPGSQTKPAAWTDLSFEELKQAVADHTTSVLTKLKNNGIDVEWVQVGNETRNGMLWDDGKADESFQNYAGLNNAGYDAAKAVYPDASIIVHVDSGDNNNLFRWLFDGLKNHGGKWDAIGLSLYPDVDNWQAINTACIANMEDMISRYGSDVVLCEVGMPWDEPEACKAFLTDLMARSKNIANNKCLGIFYWEPQSYSNWNNYSLGAFDTSGQPTVALDAFRDNDNE